MPGPGRSAPAPGDVERFRDILARQIGLRVEDSRLDELSDVLGERIAATGARGIERYLERVLAAGGLASELAILAGELTVTETYFFRDSNQFSALAERVLPEREVGASDRPLRVLSVGCSSGEEPYSIAMTALVSLPAGVALSIRAVDINAAALEKAARGRYTPWSLRATSASLAKRFFAADDPGYVLDPAVRAMVHFTYGNVLDDAADVWREGHYDVVFCRNMLMYFPAGTTRRVVARIARSLAPGGFLFVGHAETLRGLSQDYHLCHTHEAFYYQRKSVRSSITAPPPLEGLPSGKVLEQLDGSSWAGIIARSAERIEALMQGSAAEPPQGFTTHSNSPSGMRSSCSLDSAMELMLQERYAEALLAVPALPVGRHGDVDALLLRAALLTNVGRLEDAERGCREVLDLDELNAGAHYLLALCREHAADNASAIEHDRAAAHLDPGFAMPRLHLGLLAHKAGEFDVARRELGRALDLLAGEDAARVLLFGGGFSREMLGRLCRARLQSVGGVS